MNEEELTYTLKFNKKESDDSKEYVKNSSKEVEFTLENLDQATEYLYLLEVKDSNGAKATFSGSCTTFCVGIECSGPASKEVECRTCKGTTFVYVDCSGSWDYSNIVGQSGYTSEKCQRCGKASKSRHIINLRCGVCGYTPGTKYIISCSDYCYNLLFKEYESSVSKIHSRQVDCPDCENGVVLEKEEKCEHDSYTEHFYCQTHGNIVDQLH